MSRRDEEAFFQMFRKFNYIDKNLRKRRNSNRGEREQQTKPLKCGRLYNDMSQQDDDDSMLIGPANNSLKSDSSEPLDLSISGNTTTTRAKQTTALPQLTRIQKEAPTATPLLHDSGCLVCNYSGDSPEGYSFRSPTQESEVEEHEDNFRLIRNHEPRFNSPSFNNDGDYDKQDGHQSLIDKQYAPTANSTFGGFRMPSNNDDDEDSFGDLRIREQSASVLTKCNSTTNEFSSFETVDLTKDDDDDEYTFGNILNIDGLDKETNSANINDRIEVNSLELIHRNYEILKENWLEEFKQKWEKIREERNKEIQLLEDQLQELSIVRTNCIKDEFNNRLDRQLSRRDRPTLVIKRDQDDEDFLHPFNENQLELLHSCLNLPDQQVLVNKYNLTITRADIFSLCDGNWLNDVIINFYMNLLIERSEIKSHLPTVYTMNSFFTQRLMAGGYAAVKRWTRKVDIFSKDIIPIPVHVCGLHWCMAIIHLKQKAILYYDSLGHNNYNLLRALAEYLQEESMDKRKREFDTCEFKIECVSDAPRQNNGSDCGVFACMVAEYITRERPITFNQSNMTYFRQKMIVEIVEGKLIK